MTITYYDLHIAPVAQGLLTLAASDLRMAAFEGMLWLIGIVALSTLIVVVAAFVRRRYRTSELTPELGLTLAELRWMHERGDLTHHEFESLKNKLIEDMRIGNADVETYNV